MTEVAKPKSLIDELRAQGYIAAPCPFCKEVCVWAISAKLGRKIPLSPRIPVYTVIKSKDREAQAVRNELNFASHYLECAKKEEWKK